MKKQLFVILAALLSLNAWSDTCTLYDVSLIRTSNDLAESMGKARLFDLDLMMRYDDGAKIPSGEIILVEHKFYKTQILTVQNQDGHFFYSLMDGSKIELESLKAGRKLASLEKQKLKVCR